MAALSENIISSRFPSVPLPPGTYIDFLYSKVDECRAQRPAIVDYKSGRRITFGELKRLVGCVASALHKRGFGRGQVLSLFAANSLENPPIAHGVVAAGGAIHFIKPSASCEELQYHLTLVKPRFVVTTLQMASKVQEAVGKAADVQVEDVYVIGGAQTSSYRRAEELLEESGDANPLGRVEIDSKNDVAALFQTGGTTGMSKTVMLTHDAIKTSILQFVNRFLKIDEKSLSLGYVPFSHIYSTFLHYGAWLYEGCGVLNIEKFDGPQILQAIEKYKVTNLGLTPVSATTLLNLAEFEKADFSSVKVIFYGGASMSKETEQMFISKMRLKVPDVEFYQAYGMTEVSGAVIMTPKDRPAEKMGSVGFPLQGAKVKVVSLDGSGRTCGPNEAGEVLLHTPALMKGYLHDDAATKKVMRNGWIHSGDYGWYDEDEFLYVIDRIEDLISHREGVIIPTQLEALLRSHPAVLDCAIVGKKDALNGAVPAAFVVRREEVTTADLQQFVAERVEPFKQLQGGVTFVESIPKSPAGKVLRRALHHQSIKQVLRTLE